MAPKVLKLDLSGIPSAPVELTSGLEYVVAIAEAATYSITPRTFVQRELQEVGGQCPSFLDTYAHADTHGGILHQVLRFGINADTLNANAITPKSGVIAQKIPDVAVASSKGSKSATAGTTDIETHRVEAKKQITQYEEDNVTKAIAHLSIPRQTAKTALVDIFARDASGNIATATDIHGNVILTTAGVPKPEVHAVVLFAQGGKYLVIDPNNNSYSHILAGASNDIRLCFGKEKLKIYTPQDKTKVGPGADQWRDCIDVAVKLAFNIEKNLILGMLPLTVREDPDVTKNVGEIDLEALKASHFVKEITNQQAMYKILPAEVEMFSIRLKQSSDVKVEKKVTACLKILHKTSYDLTKKLEATVLDLYEVLPKVEKKVEDFYGKAEAIVQYSDFENECVDFAKWIDQTAGSTESTTLLGMALAAIDSLP